MKVMHLGWGRLLVGAAFLVPLLDASAQTQADQAVPPGPEQLASKVEEYMAARVKRDHFSGSILIARDGKVLFSQGYGMANLEHDVPNTPQTKFRLGSITKQFTAMAILILQERGKLNVHDKIKKYFPDAPKAWDEITIEHLLTHTSGIPNYTESLEFLQDPAGAGHAQGADRQVQGQAARLQAGREVQVQQLGLHHARPDHRDRLGQELSVVHERGDLRPAGHERHGLRQRHGRSSSTAPAATPAAWESC